MPIRPSERRAGERGATLVHMAVSMVAVMAFSALVIDYGIFWVARRQAQNSADAGALAGAIALAFEDAGDLSPTGLAARSAVAAAQRNLVWGAQPSVVAETDVHIQTNLPGCMPSEVCIKVDVYRAVGRSNSLPTFFGRLVGVNTQDVQATATARVISGTQSNCLRPWAVADKWEEHVKWVCNNGDLDPNCQQGHWEANTQPWTIHDSFDKWDRSGNTAVLDTSITNAGFTYDVYTPPSGDDPGTGFALRNADGSYRDYGTLLTLKLGGSNDRISSGWFLSLDMSSLCTNPECPTNQGADTYRFAITDCVGGTAGIGSTIPIQTGNMSGPTSQGVYRSVGQGPASLVERDPGAYWVPGTDGQPGHIEGSCAGTGRACADGVVYGSSPRIVPVPLFNVDQYLSTNPSGSGGTVAITNVFGFFILTPEQAQALGMTDGQGNTGDEVYGVIVSVPGLTGGTSTIPPTSSFLQTIVLVR